MNNFQSLRSNSLIRKAVKESSHVIKAEDIAFKFQPESKVLTKCVMLGTGYAVPEKIVTNEDIEKNMV